jgi:pimeloyl-ACP methyl ester carboxylesterase
MRRAALALALLLALVAADATSAAPPHVRKLTIHYRAHDGHRRAAVLVLPSWYGRHNHPPIPLVISPHGRGVSGRGNARLWGALPAVGGFAVVNPDGEGRNLSRLSWGYPQQIHDLARMPNIVHAALPWFRVDRRRVYAFGSSMGGQETLLLVARHPALLAGAAAFDSVTDFALQYRNFRRLRCRAACRRAWDGPMWRNLQLLARHEVGGTPRTAPRKFAERSPLAFARMIANACVPLQLWWSSRDKIVTDQRRQSERLFERIRRLNDSAPVSAYVGWWRHSHEMRASTRLPLALQQFGLLPPNARPSGLRVTAPPTNACARRYVEPLTFVP